MNANYDELFFVPGFELPQLREYMDAVNSPIGPEIQQNDLAPHISQAELATTCMNPVEIVRKIRRANGRSWCEFSRHWLKSSPSFSFVLTA